MRFHKRWGSLHEACGGDARGASAALLYRSVAYSPIARGESRQSHAIPTKVSTNARLNATRGADAPPLMPRRARTSVVSAGATICGKRIARFQTPIPVPIALVGKTLQAIAQSATRKTPQPMPATTVATIASVSDFADDE